MPPSRAPKHKPSLREDVRDGLRILKRLGRDPNVGQDLRHSRLFRRISAVLPPKFLRHYVYPLLADRGAAPYRPERFFESFYAAREHASLSDGATVSTIEDELTSRYHFAVTEKALLECLMREGVCPTGSVLDVGSGAGHWIDFYRQIFRPARVVGVDIARSSVEALSLRLADATEAAVLQADVSAAGFELGERFELINAIGVMFHIVEDEAWERALGNLAHHLEPGGHLVVGGQFGWITANVQFHSRDDFASWNEGTADGVRLVNKRIRSLRRWKRAARAVGLRFAALQRSREARGFYTPENNILLLAKDAAPAQPSPSAPTGCYRSPSTPGETIR